MGALHPLRTTPARRSNLADAQTDWILEDYAQGLHHLVECVFRVPSIQNRGAYGADEEYGVINPRVLETPVDGRDHRLPRPFHA